MPKHVALPTAQYELKAPSVAQPSNGVEAMPRRASFRTNSSDVCIFTSCETLTNDASNWRRVGLKNLLKISNQLRNLRRYFLKNGRRPQMRSIRRQPKHWFQCRLNSHERKRSRCQFMHERNRVQQSPFCRLSSKTPGSMRIHLRYSGARHFKSRLSSPLQ